MLGATPRRLHDPTMESDDDRFAAAVARLPLAVVR